MTEANGVQFPWWGLLPKRETGAAAFARARPTSDGRGTFIAVFDSGIDPAASGMRFTSTGEPKVVERYDCSGCGDVDTSATCQLRDGGALTGITGRRLRVPVDDWTNPSGEWRIGVVHPYAIYPQKLVERVQEYRKEATWSAPHKLATAAASRELQEFEAKHAAPLSPDDKLYKEELEAQVEALHNLDKKYNDVGPTYDCVLFNDGNVWRACIDTSEVGDLSKGVLLGEYSKTHEHQHLTEVDLMTISINVHNNGNVLEIVGMCSTHGTHVASIASGHFPDEPEKDGLAPGAQIISLGIGDGRLGSMETGTSLVRACIKVMELSTKYKVDVINMSYGEHAHWSDSGRIGELMNEVINKYGVVWVVSAGNHGPALSTVGAPPDISQNNMIGVGAYVSPSMVTASYGLRPKFTENLYTWSSRGPCIDGAAGVSICAPGGAITSVPNFTLRGTQLMNGTSMSAPHVAGAISCIISGLKQENISYSPYSIKRALENTARYLPNIEPFVQGCGLLNVEEAYKFLCTYADAPERNVRFAISCGKNNNKGIYFRKVTEDKAKDVSITVEPFFAGDFRKPEGLTDNKDKISFNIKLSLACDVHWVQCPPFLDLMNIARSFPVRVDPESLTPGVHHTSIKAYDVNCLSKGSVFQIPVTVVRPEPLVTEEVKAPYLKVDNFHFQPGAIQRHFVTVPEFATWAVLEMSTKDPNGSRFMLHCMQLIPRMSCKNNEFQKIIVLVPNCDSTLPFQVKGGYILEVAIAKYWASTDSIIVNYKLEFYGIKPETNPIVLHGAEGIHCIRLRSLQRIDCMPQVSLKYTTHTVRPSETKLCPLTERDVIPPGRQIYEIINTYNFYIAKATEVTPNIPILSDVLYESEFDSQLWMLFDSNKQHITSGDAYPTKYTVKLEKGDYVLKLCVRHEKKELLEKLNDTPLLVTQKLQQCLSLDVYNSQAQACTGKKGLAMCISPNHAVPIYIGYLPSDKIGKNITPGQYLSGYITFAKDELGKKLDTYCLKYILPDQPKKPNNNGNNKDKDKSKSEEYSDAVRDMKTFWLAKFEGDAAKKLYDELIESYPDHLITHLAYLNSLEPMTDLRKLPKPNSKCKDWSKTNCETVITIANKVIEAIDQEKLLAYFGLKNDTRPDANKIKIKQEKQRSILLEALNKRGIALCKLHLISEDSDTKVHMDEIKHTLGEILKFSELTDSKVLHFALWHSVVMVHFGRSIKFLNKLVEEHMTAEVEDKLVTFYKALEWDHAANFTMSTMPRRFPAAYRLF